MKILEYPTEEFVAGEVRCSCGALLEYLRSDIFWKHSLNAYFKCIKCPLCSKEIIIETIPGPSTAQTLEFWY